MMQFFGDSLKSLLSGLGLSTHDKRSTSMFSGRSFTDEDMRNAYRTSWIAKKIVDIPVEDALRRPRVWQGISPDEVSKIEALEKKLGLYAKAIKAWKLARRDGRAAIYINVGDNDLESPLNFNSLRGIRNIVVMSKRDYSPTTPPNRVRDYSIRSINSLSSGAVNRDIDSEYYGKPEFYQLNTTSGQSLKIHASRFIHFNGDEKLDVYDDESGGDTGDSSLLPVMEAILDAGSTIANVASLVFEANVDIYKIPNFTKNLKDDKYKEAVISRFSLANAAKSNQRALLLDKDEEHQSKTINFSALKDVVREFIQICAGAADIPMTRFLGTSTSGLNNAGDGDMNIYYDRIDALRELELRPALGVFDEILITAALGNRPPEAFYLWPALKQTTDKERAEVAKAVADVVKILVDSGAFLADEMREAIVNEFGNTGFFGVLEQELDKSGDDDDLDLGDDDGED